MNRKVLTCILILFIFIYGCELLGILPQEDADGNSGKSISVCQGKKNASLPPQGTGILPAPNLIQASPLEKFEQYYSSLALSGREEEILPYIISRSLDRKEAVALGKYDRLRHLKELEGDEEEDCGFRVTILGADLDGDGREEIIEYTTYDSANNISIYKKEEEEYSLMYRGTLPGESGFMQAACYEGEIFLMIQNLPARLDKEICWIQTMHLMGVKYGDEMTIYHLEGWRPSEMVSIVYEGRPMESRLIFYEEEYAGEAGRIMEEVKGIWEGLPDSITDIDTSSFWGSGEECISDTGRGWELNERYEAGMESHRKVLEQTFPEGVYSFQKQRFNQAFRCDINNDGVEEEYIKNYGHLGIVENSQWKGGYVSCVTGKMYGSHEGEDGLLCYMEAGGRETDFLAMCGLDIWNRELSPHMFWVQEVDGKNVTYILYGDDKRLNFELAGYEITGTWCRKVLEAECSPILARTYREWRNLP